jgi:triosephosphate isomerase (TIM)
MTRRRLIAGNWKMNKTPDETEAFVRALLQGGSLPDAVDVLLFPPFTSLERAGTLLHRTGVALGAQDVHPAASGAYTGEISCEMVAACGCEYVLAGHSERRTLFAEPDEFVHRKLRAALAAGLRVVLCVGETLAEHQAGETEDKVMFQLTADLAGLSTEAMERVVVAYEPIWAIGTGETATPEQAQETIHLIRHSIAIEFGESAASGIRILYGGSVKPQNAASILDQDDIDGALIGGASLSAESFKAIIDLAG